MVYTPVNPDFGGSPFNAAGLLAEANAQNHFQAPSAQSNPQQDFTNTITSALLGELSTKIADTIFNSTSGQSGNFITGTEQISYVNTGGSISLTVTSLTTGQTTTFSGIPSGM
jgi:curli production assembly/transport component CsgF